MADGSSVRSWTDDELVAVFGGADVVFARDGLTAPTAVPPVLRPEAGGVPMPAWSEQVARLHPADRAATVRAWWDSLQHPGELRRLEVRSQARDSWRRIEVQYVNLLDQPGVRAVIVSSTDRGPIEVDDERDGGARFDRPAWVFQELDAVGTIGRTEGDARAIFGVDAAELAGRNILELLDAQDHEAALSMWVDLMASPGATRVIRQRIVRADGTTVWIESTVTNRLDDEAGTMVGISLDITERLEQEEALRASQEEFRTLAEEVPAAVFRAQADGRVTFGNGRWFDLTASVGVAERLIDLVAIEHRVAWRERWEAFTAPAGADTTTLEYPTPDHRRVLSVHCRKVRTTAGDARFVGVLTDVTDVEELRRRADHDALTGLLNREAFERELAGALDGGADLAVAFVDLDGFKQINDELGHQAGDRVLCEVARRLTASVRPGDTVGRYGGDEFVVLCAGLPSSGEDGLAARITHALTPPVRWEGAEWPLQASIGSARARTGDAVSDVVRRADHAMYEDKRRGRRRTRRDWSVGAAV